MRFRPIVFIAVAAISATWIAFSQSPENQPAKTPPGTTYTVAGLGEQKTVSVALRVRRVTYEDAYVAVPATDTIMKIKPDGSPQIDMDKFVSEAIRISKDKRVEWKVESSITEAHPIQQGPPQGRKSFDFFYAEQSVR
jgi:hypothetical protein